MRELDRIASESTLERCAIVGAGRLGHALAAALRDAGLEVEGPLGRGARPARRRRAAVRPRRRDPAAAAAPIPLGAAGRALLRRHDPRALRRPRGLQPPPADDRPGGRGRASRAPAVRWPGTSDRALAWRAALATALRMTAVEVPDEDRAAYHAAASIAANFLVTLEGAAERLAATAGVAARAAGPARPRRAGELGRQRRRAGADRARSPAATRPRSPASARRSSERAPDLLDAFDALVAASRVLAAS